MNPETYFITGASSGFGRAPAEAVLVHRERAVVAARRTGPQQSFVQTYRCVTRTVLVTVQADVLVADWARELGAYQQAKHHFPGFETKIDGDQATCTYTGQATPLERSFNIAAKACTEGLG